MRIDKDRRTMPSNTADDTEFAARFQQFLLTEFAEGSEIVGSWPIRFPRPELPAWDVEIEIAGEAIDRRVPEFPDK